MITRRGLLKTLAGLCCMPFMPKAKAKNTTPSVPDGRTWLWHQHWKSACVTTPGSRTFAPLPGPVSPGPSWVLKDCMITESFIKPVRDGQIMHSWSGYHIWERDL